MKNQRRHRILTTGLILLTIVLLAGCGRERAEPTPTPTKTPVTGGQPADTAQATPLPASDAGAPESGATPTPGQAQPEAQPTPTVATQKSVAVINASLLNVRNQPDANGEVLQTVEQGQEFDVIGRSEDGAWIQFGRRQPGNWLGGERVRRGTPGRHCGRCRR